MSMLKTILEDEIKTRLLAQELKDRIQRDSSRLVEAIHVAVGACSNELLNLKLQGDYLKAVPFLDANPKGMQSIYTRDGICIDLGKRITREYLRIRVMPGNVLKNDDVSPPAAALLRVREYPQESPTVLRDYGPGADAAVVVQDLFRALVRHVSFDDEVASTAQTEAA